MLAGGRLVVMTAPTGSCELIEFEQKGLQRATRRALYLNFHFTANSRYRYTFELVIFMFITGVHRVTGTYAEVRCACK